MDGTDAYWEMRFSTPSGRIQGGSPARAAQKPKRCKLRTNITYRATANPPIVTASQAVEQTAGMADRFNRMFLRTLRALRDLRRYSPTVIVQNAGQVNVGEQQVNVSGGNSPKT
jgi:hypothetical protein